MEIPIELVSIGAGDLRHYVGPVLAAPGSQWGVKQPSSPGKFTIGLFFAGIAFGVITLASIVSGGSRVSPMWLVVVYFFRPSGTVLEPRRLKHRNETAPGRMVGLMLGVWFYRYRSAAILGLTTRLCGQSN